MTKHKAITKHEVTAQVAWKYCAAASDSLAAAACCRSATSRVLSALKVSMVGEIADRNIKKKGVWELCPKEVKYHM